MVFFGWPRSHELFSMSKIVLILELSESWILMGILSWFLIKIVKVWVPIAVDSVVCQSLFYVSCWFGSFRAFYNVFFFKCNGQSSFVTLRELCFLIDKISIHPHKGLSIIKCDLHLGPFLGSSTRSSSVGSASARGEGEDGPTCRRFLSMISGGRSSLDWREKVKLLFLAITTSPFWGSNGGKYFSPPSALLALICSIKFLLCFSSTASVTWKKCLDQTRIK